MTVNRTTLLDLPLPVTGTESGTWGNVTNNGLTEYVDIAIAGMSNLTSANFSTGALTIETTEGDSNGTNITATSAQYAGFRVSSLAQNSIITVGNTGTNPARSYRLINADATYTLTFKATGQNGITLQPGQTAVVAFNGTDYVIVGMVGAGTVTDNAVVRFDGTTGKLVQNSVVTIADSTGDISGVGTLNATTADLTNLEVTNLKAKDGTAAGSIADSTGVVTLASSVLTTTDINGGTIDNTTIGGATPAVGSFTQVNADNLRLDGNALTSTNSNGNIDLTPNGTGEVNISKVDIDSGAIDGTAIGANSASTGAFTTLSASSTATFAAGAVGTPSITTAGDTNTGIFFPAADTIAFAEGGAEAMRIDSSGNVGIGVTSPANKLDVAGDSSASARLQLARYSADAGGSNMFLFKSRNATIGSQTVVQSGDALGTINWSGSDGTDAEVAASISAAVDGTPGTNDMPGRLVFSTTPDGSGTPTERMRISADGTIKTSSTISVGNATPSTSGAGITFPATQSASTDANTLDDYEEGTFTLSNGGNTTYTTRSGRYTKIGNFVKCSFFHNINTIGTGSATTLSGLPFTPSSTAPTINGGVVTYISGLAVSALAIGVYADNAAQIIFMTRNANDTNATTQLPAVMGNSFAVYAEVSYLID